MPVLRRRPGPGWVLAAIGLAILVPTVVYALAVKSFTVWPDELTYVKEAVEIAHKHAPLTAGDRYFNSYAQLLPLLLAPGYGLLSTPNALALAHVLAAVALVSTLVPVYLLARATGLGRGHAQLAAALATVTPWLSFAGTVMTESLALPAFAWALLACQRAIAAPSPRRDVVALLAIALATLVRAQFVAVLPAFLLALLVVSWRSGLSWRRALRGHRLLAVCAGLCALVVLGAAVTGSLSRLGGNYGTAVGQLRISLDVVRSGIDNLVYVVFAAGVLPLVFGTGWAIFTLRRPRDEATTGENATAALLLALLACLVLEVGLFGGTFLTGTTTVTGRYLFYLALPGSVGLVAWVVRGGGLSAVVGSAVAYGVLAAFAHSSALGSAVDAPDQQAGGRSLPQRVLDDLHVFGHVVLPLGILAATAALVILLRRIGGARALALAAAALLVFGAGAAAYRMHAILHAANARAALLPRDWGDHALGGARAVVITGPIPSTTATEDVWETLLFANKSAQQAVALPGGSSLGSVNGDAYLDVVRGRIVTPRLGIDPERAAVDPGVAAPLTETARYAMVSAADLRFAARGPVVARNGDVRVIRLLPGAPLAWALLGADAAGDVPRTSALRLFSPHLVPPGTASLTVGADSTARCPCRVTFGRTTATLRRSQATTVRASLPPATSSRREIALRVPPGTRVLSIRFSGSRSGGEGGYPDP